MGIRNLVGPDSGNRNDSLCEKGELALHYELVGFYLPLGCLCLIFKYFSEIFQSLPHRLYRLCVVLVIGRLLEPNIFEFLERDLYAQAF